VRRAVATDGSLTHDPLTAAGELGMKTVEVVLDRELFAIDVAARTAHRYTADYYVDLRADVGEIFVRLTPKGAASVDSNELAQRFRNDALDDRLRALVAQQTGDLQAALLRAALTEAQPRDRGEQ
jgi:His-Xaa-Ser system protein HxsD